MHKQSVTILGSTGSIGCTALSVIEQRTDDFNVFALTANTNVQALIEQCKRFNPRYAVIANPDYYAELKDALDNTPTQAMSGAGALIDLAEMPDADIVIVALVGIAGLAPTLSAAQKNTRILLANKEILVSAGKLFMRKIVDSGAELLPIDSEHNALFQCLDGSYHRHGQSPDCVEKVVLTASGGPFWKTPLSEFDKITPEQACAHPNWDMGRKISVDSATFMNKGFEVVEACYLFDFEPQQVEVVVHPQSIMHALVQWKDGSVLAQMAIPDMYIPIAHALFWPKCNANTLPRLDLAEVGQLIFEHTDTEKFPCLAYAYTALQEGEASLIALNAANEVAVAQFLEKNICFKNIPLVIEKTMNYIQGQSSMSNEKDLEQIFDCHTEAIEYAERLCTKL